MAVKRMDNTLIVVDDLEAVKAFFIALGLELEGETTVEGPSIGSLIGLENVRATLAMLRPPDGHGGVELDKFHTPSPVRYGPVNAPVNTLGMRRLMFAVDDIDEVVARMRSHGTEIIGRAQRRRGAEAEDELTSRSRGATIASGARWNARSSRFYSRTPMQARRRARKAATAAAGASSAAAANRTSHASLWRPLSLAPTT